MRRSATADGTEARAAIAAEYARLDRAMQRTGVESLRQLQKALTDILAPGELREKMLGGIKSTIAAGGDRDEKKVFAHNIQILSVRAVRDRAVVSVQQTADVLRVDSSGAYGPAGKQHRVKGVLLYEDIWEKRGGKWKMTQNNPVNSTAYVDGKLWNPGPGGELIR